MGWLPTGPQELERELANMEAKQAAVWDSHSGVQVLQNITYGNWVCYWGESHNPNHIV